MSDNCCKDCNECCGGECHDPCCDNCADKACCCYSTECCGSCVDDCECCRGSSPACKGVCGCIITLVVLGFIIYFAIKQNVKW